MPRRNERAPAVEQSRPGETQPFPFQSLPFSRRAQLPLRSWIPRHECRSPERGPPLSSGRHRDGVGVNFALFSANATKVELCLFDASGEHEIDRIVLPEYTDEVWHGYLPDARPGTVYGYRVHGPYEPTAGHRFNPNKLLLDPYARQVIDKLTSNPALFGYKMESGPILPGTVWSMRRATSAFRLSKQPA